MLHILFIILKILGILLLVILGLLFLCLLAVLFVPIRYRGNGSYHSIKDFGVHLHIHWLLHAVSLRIAYENELRYAVKLFGFRIFGSESEEKDTESGRVREGTQAADSDELEFVNAQEKTEDDDLDTGELILRAEAASEKTDAAIEKAEETARLLEEAVKRRSAQREAEMSQAVKNADAFPDVKEAGVSEAEGETHRAKNELKSNPSQEKRESFLHRIISWFKQKWSALRQSLSKLLTRINSLEHKRQSVLAFIENEENQKSFRLIKRQLMRVLRHIFPRKLSGQVTFGVKDPYLMGQILSVAAFLYPVYGKKVDLTPVMDANALDGELSFRGRVQIGVLALMALRIWMDKNVRTQVYKYRNEEEDNMADNQFASTIGALFQGMDEFVTTKTVVGEPVTVGDAIILPLVDVTCGMAAGAFGQSAKEKNAGGMSAKMTPSAVLVIQNGMTKVVNIKHQDALTKVLDMAPDLVNKFVGGSTGPIDAETMQTAEKMAGEMEEKK